MTLCTESDYVIPVSNLRGTFGNCAMTLPIETGVRVESKKKVGGLGVPAPDRETRRPTSATAAYSYGKALRHRAPSRAQF